MNILITGITGFVGSHLANTLSKYNNVFGLSSSYTNKTFLLKSRCTLYNGSVNDYKLLREIISKNEIEAIYHFAAYSIVRSSSKDPLNAYQTNVMGTVNVLEAARNVGNVKRIIVASSDKAYGDHDILPYKEDFKLCPKNTYDTSKACMDLISQTYFHNYGMDVRVTRCSNVYGPGDYNFSRLVPNTIRRIKLKLNPLIYSDVKFMNREFIYVGDVVSAYKDILYTKTLNHCVYNIGGTGPKSIIGVINKIGEELGYDNVGLTVIDRQSSFKEINKQYIDSSRLEEDTGWKPTTAFDSGIKSTVDWYIKNA